MAFTDFTGLLGIEIFILLIILRFNIFSQAMGVKKWGVWVVIALLLLLPVNELSVAAAVRAVMGDLSITTLVLLSLALWGDLVSSPAVIVEASKKNHLLLLAVVVGVFFYPLVLGWGIFDPYRLGFGQKGFIVGLLLLATLAWWRRQSLIAVTISCAVLAWAVGWYESNNLWDYLLDPWLFLFALFSLLRVFGESLRRKFI